MENKKQDITNFLEKNSLNTSNCISNIFTSTADKEVLTWNEDGLMKEIEDALYEDQMTIFIGGHKSELEDMLISNEEDIEYRDSNNNLKVYTIFRYMAFGSYYYLTPEQDIKFLTFLKTL